MTELKKALFSKLTLVGFMGAGKSTLGRILAEKLVVQFHDLDQKLEEHFRISIPAIFSRYGEAEFRKAETRLLKELLNAPETCVISTGGGVVLSGENRDALANSSLCVFLDPPFEMLFQRIQSDDPIRPLAIDAGKEGLLAIRESRMPLYKQVAHFCPGKFEPPEDVATEIIDWLNDHLEPPKGAEGAKIKENDKPENRKCRK